jgi:hypothetical protein
MAKITRSKVALEPATDALKKDITTKPLLESLSQEYLGTKQKFQMEGTIIVRKLVGVEVELYHSSMLPTVFKGPSESRIRRSLAIEPSNKCWNCLTWLAPNMPLWHLTFSNPMKPASRSSPVITQYAGLKLEGVSTLSDYDLGNIKA